MRRLALLGLLWAAPALAQSGAMVALRPGSAVSVMGQGRGAMSGTAATGAVPASYVGPGDLVSGATAWYSCTRAYSAAYAAPGTNPACTIRRASDNATTTLAVLSTGLVNVAAATSFCASTTCYVSEAFDESGSGYNATQATAAAQPQLSFSCIGSLPCMSFAGGQYLSPPSITLNQPLSFSAVAVRSANFTSQTSIFAQATAPYTQLSFGTSANTIFVYGGTVANVSQADSATHAFQALLNGTSSGINVDGSLTTTNSGTSGVSGVLSIGGDGAQYLSGNIEEAGIWPSAFAPTQQTAVCHNQNVAYSLGLSC